MTELTDFEMTYAYEGRGSHLKGLRAVIAADRARGEEESPVHIFPLDLEMMCKTETTATVYSVPVGSPEGKSIPLYTRPPAAVPDDKSVMVNHKTWCAIQRLIISAHELSHHAEEYDFDDGMGCGAVQHFWDELGRALDAVDESPKPNRE